MMVLVLEQCFGDRPDRLGVTLGVVAGSTLLPVVIAVDQLVRGNRFVDENIDVGRINGSFIHPNALGTFCSIVMALILGVYPHLSVPRRRLAALVGVGTAVMLVSSYARASWLGIIVAIVVVALLQDRRLLIGLAVGTVALLLFVPSVTTR